MARSTSTTRFGARLAALVTVAITVAMASCGDGSSDRRDRVVADLRDETSITDDDLLVDVAEALGDGDVVQAAAFTEPVSLDQALADASPPVAERLRDDVHLVLPYDVALLVELDDGGDVRTEMLVIHADDDVADRNHRRIGDLVLDGRLPSTGAPVNGVFPGSEVRQRDTIVRVTTDGPGHFDGQRHALSNGDILLVE